MQGPFACGPQCLETTAELPLTACSKWWGCGVQVGAWLTQRAQAVEEMTGQLHTAAHLLRLAQEINPEDTLARHLSTVASLQDGLQGTPVCFTPQRQVETNQG